jgi:glycosyltransferase involved in cell wall biosynthesis
MRNILDAILVKTIQLGLIGLLAKKIFRVPVAVLIEGEQEYRNKNFFNQMALRIVSKYSRMIVQTKEIQRQLYQKVGIKAEVIPNGIYISQDRANGEKVLFIGRLIRDKKNDKGVRYLIDAVKDLPVDTYIIGDGPEKTNLMTRAHKNKRIHFMGEVYPDKVPSFLKQGRVLVLPSVYGEGLPNVIIEALCFGLPVIATRTAGIVDILEHGKTGFLLTPKDSSEIKTYIHKLMEDSELWKIMSQNCRREAKNYEWSKIAPLFESLLKFTGNTAKSK